MNSRFISGWCYYRLVKKRTVTITAYADQTFLGTFTNNGFRPDVKRLGLHPTGVCAFDFSFPSSFDPAQYSSLRLYFDSVKSAFVSILCKDMKALKPELSRPICFMHIPKTAGTSFNGFVRTCFADTEMVTHLERYDALVQPESLDGVRYLSGHLTYEKLRRLPGIQSYDLYAIIREPFGHLHSHLNYVRGVKRSIAEENLYTYQHNDTIKALSDKLSIIDFHDQEQIRRFVNSVQGYELEFFDNIQTRYFLDYCPERVGEADLKCALNNLHHFKSIGLTEQYDRFLKRFCADIGLTYEPQKQRLNMSSHYRLFSPDSWQVKELLLPLVRFDLELYQHISESSWNN